MRNLRVLVAALLVVAVGAGCSSGDDDADSTTTAGSEDPGSSTTAPPPAQASTFVPTDCWWPLPDDQPAAITLECGTVEVPSDPADPESEPYTLAVMRAHHDDAPADAPPTVLLHGGPGGDALSQPLNLGDGSLLAKRDLITFDQRGSGRSLPSLNCPEKEDAILDVLGTTDPWETEYAVNREAAQACYERLTEDEGIDLNRFNTPASVHDMEVLRETFGIDEWNVWGGSYGSRLGLDYARTHPDRVQTLLIDSVYGTEIGGVPRELDRLSDALDRLFVACADDEACAGLGDLEDLYDEATEKLDADPEEVTTTVKVNGEPQDRDFQVVGSDIGAGMFAAMYQSDLIPAIPGIISGIAHDERAIVPLYLQTGVPRLVDMSEGAYFSIECADSGRLLGGEDGAAELTADRTDDSLVALTTAATFCDVWPVEHVDASFNEVATPDVPTLVFGGTLDPITPYTDSEHQAEVMPDAQFVGVPRGGHGAAGFDECTKSVRNAFWDDPTAPIDDCTESIEPLPFAVEAG